MADLTGQIIDNGMYHLIKLLGEGTFGEVYLAKKIRTKIPTSTFVAVKILKPDPTKNQDDFLKEVRTLVRLKHPHIVSLLDFGIDGKIAFLVMEYAPNGTLRKRHPSGSILTPETVLTYIEPLASALQYAHDEGVLHRDVKPINILLGQNNKILLSDLGTADTAHNENSLITQEDLFGTISYMAPEQINKRPEMASDQYALGTMTYEWLCGARPFQGNSLEIMTQHLTKPPPPLREKNPAIHYSIENVVLKALAKEPRDRHANIQAFAQAFKDAIRQIEEKDTKRSNTKPDPPSALLAPAPQIEPAVNIPGVLSPPFSNRTTVSLTPRGPASIPATPLAAGIEAGNPGQLPRPRPPSGKVAGAASLGVATNPPHAAPSQNRLAPGPSNVTPYPGRSRGVPPRYGHSTVNPKRWFIVGLLILAIALAFTGVLAFAQPESLPGKLVRNFLPVPQSLATITITPNTQLVQDTYTLIGAQTTNPTTHKVSVRIITGIAQSPIIPVQATGHSQHPAISAQGQLTFSNSLGTARQLNAGFSLPIGGAVSLVLDQTAYIAASNGITAGQATVPAHAVPAGLGGNIGADTLAVTACCATNITVSNTAAFTGGQDAVNYTFLQQSDVNNAISQLIKDTTKQEAISDLSKQLHTGEPLLTAPRCISTLQADEPIGDQGTNVSSANVMYWLKCTVTAYDNLGVQNIIKDLLTQKATTTLGVGYVLVNNIQASFIGQTTTKNTLSFFFTGKGVWAYLFSDAQKLSLEKAIAGKTVADAQTLLKNTPGVSNATINVNGGNTLPTDYNQISIVIQPIAGLGGGTPPPTSGSPTVTNPTVQSGTPGSNGKGGSAPPTGGG